MRCGLSLVVVRGFASKAKAKLSTTSKVSKSKAPLPSPWQSILGLDEKGAAKEKKDEGKVNTTTKAKKTKKASGEKAEESDPRQAMRDRWAQLLRERAATQSSLTETARNRRISFATLIEAPDLALYRDKPVFSVLSWNIMSDAHLDAVGLAHLKALPRERRALLLLETMIELAPSLLALQEVEHDLYDTLLAPQLALHGYAGVYHERGQLSPFEHKAWAEARQDGCALFWKTDKFELLDSERAELRQVIHEPGMHKFGLGDPAFLRQYMYYSNIVSLAQLRLIESGHVLALANTHIYSNQLRASLQIAQIHAVLMRLQRAATALTTRTGLRVAALLCGDLNSMPASPLVHYVARGELSATHPALEYNGRRIARDTLRHSLTLESGYRTYPEPPRQLDYIFASRDELVPLALLKLPKNYRGVVRSGSASEEQPSDHLPIMVHYAFADREPRRVEIPAAPKEQAPNTEKSKASTGKEQGKGKQKDAVKKKDSKEKRVRRQKEAALDEF